MISTEIQEAFAFEASKIAVTTNRPVEEVYQALMNNYNRALGLVERRIESQNFDYSENAKKFK